ncbi:MAG: gamma carbonic anhydrase family protein [Verrucomicrobiota bacterium]
MNLTERLQKYFGQTPRVEQAAFVAPDAVILGDVELGKNSSVWYGSILRADIQSIRIGEATNLQDGVIIHLADELGTYVGDYCTVGHGALLHACTIGNECLIGMRATILDGARIGNQCIVGANSLVPKNFSAPDGSLIYGSPAKIIRSLFEKEISELKSWAEKYIEVALAHKQNQITARTRDQIML